MAGTNGFTFDGVDGNKHTLPPASSVMETLSFGDFLDLADAEDGMMKMAVRMLRTAPVEPDAMEALRALPVTRGGEVLTAWFATTGPGGVAAPQS
jgi:hypothetical protein